MRIFQGIFALLAFLALSLHQTLAAPPDDTLRFTNPADQALYEQGEKLRQKQEDCMGKREPGCLLSNHDYIVLNKSTSLIDKMKEGKYRLELIEGAKKDLPDALKDLQGDQKALQDYKSKHPVITVLSQIPAFMRFTELPGLQWEYNQDSGTVKLSQERIKAIPKYESQITSLGLEIVPAETNSAVAK